MRSFLVLVLFSLTLFAYVEKKELILNNFISKNGSVFINSKDLDFGKIVFKNVKVKLKINKEILKNKTYYLKIFCNTDALIFSNIKYKGTFDEIIVKLTKNSPSELDFHFEYEKEKTLDFRILVVNEFEYKYMIKSENLIFGISYGIMFAAFLYNFVIFLYTRQKSFIYYSLMQITLIAILYYITYLLRLTYISENQQIFIDFLETLSVLLVILFSKETLYSKKVMPFINKIFNFLIYINIIDLISIFIFSKSILYLYLPRSVVLSILVIASIIALAKGQKTAIFYFLGWLVLFIILLISEYTLLGVDGLYVLHFGFPLESLILSFALGYKFKQTIDESNEKERIMVHQSKLAAMGEMINNIAHQWRQPLTHLSFINMDLHMASENKELNKKYLVEKLDESNEQLEFMSSTIDHFKNFYSTTRKKEFFSVKEATNKTLKIIKPSLDNSSIRVIIKIQNDKKIKAYENEYSQVILNLLSNAKDVLLERRVKNPEIKITIKVQDNKSIVTVCDNAGGINKELIDKIFEPYFTTKDKSSGIGLYMSKTIIEDHLKGRILVKNSSLGACFSVEV